MLVILAIGVYWILTSKATVNVRIENSHTFDLEYELYVDGKLKAEGIVPADSYAEEEITVYLDSECESHGFYLKAMSMGWSRIRVYEAQTTEMVCTGKSIDITLSP